MHISAKPVPHIPAPSGARATSAICPPAIRLLVAAPLLVLASCALPPQRSVPPPAPAPAPTLPRVAEPPAPAPAAPVPAPPPTTQAPVPPAPEERGAALRAWVEQQSRLYRVAAPLLINNTELCPQHAKPILGFTAKNRYSFSSGFIEAAQASLGLGDELRVMDVLPGSGAEQAGLRKGDVLVAVEIEPAPQGPGAEHMAAALIGEETQGRDSLHLGISRAGERMAFDIPLTPACAMALDLGNSDDVGSFSDGRRVMLTRGMLGFARSDQELAYALATEIARNEVISDARPAMAELIDRLHTIGSAAASGDAPPATQGHSASDDSTDRLALYLLARAGYDIDGFPAFLDRLDAANGSAAPENPPGADARAAMLEQAVREVKTKKEDGQPLVP